MPRIVLAAVLLLLSGQAARADDFKTCASGAPDYAIMACTNLIEGGKLDNREQAIGYSNRGVGFRVRGVFSERLPISIAPSSSTLASRQSRRLLSAQGGRRPRIIRLRPGH